MPGGSTALHEALGQCIVRTDARLAATAADERSGRVVVVIMTDGQNTDPSEFGLDRLRAMVTERLERRGWEFVYIGASLDAIRGDAMLAGAASLGIRSSNAAVVRSAGADVGASYGAATEAVLNYRNGGTAVLSNSGNLVDPSKDGD